MNREDYYRRGRSKATCHADRDLYARGLCASCYLKPYVYARRKEYPDSRSRNYALLTPVVYVCIAGDGTPDYVGRGTYRRARQHAYKDWWTPQHILLTMTCESEWQAMEYEGKWGAHYLPRYNIEGYRHTK